MPKGVFKNPEERARKISDSKRGKKRVFSDEWKEKVKRNLRHDIRKGTKHSKETIEKMRSYIKESRYNYILDRSLLKKEDRRNDSAYKEWRKNVYSRDNFKCKIANSDCSGKITAHHILPWRDYLELRYDINNGITLCHAHHPHKRAEESKMSPYFQELINKMS